MEGGPALFQACGRQRARRRRFHGGDGPLRVANQRSPRPIASAFVDACAENQIRRNNDFNGPEQEGAGLYQVTQFWAREGTANAARRQPPICIP